MQKKQENTPLMYNLDHRYISEPLLFLPAFLWLAMYVYILYLFPLTISQVFSHLVNSLLYLNVEILFHYVHKYILIIYEDNFQLFTVNIIKNILMDKFYCRFF